MNINTYNRILQIRTSLKSIQQLSWNISQIEKRYPLEGLSDSDLDELLIAYMEYLPVIESILVKMKQDVETTDSDIHT